MCCCTRLLCLFVLGSETYHLMIFALNHHLNPSQFRISNPAHLFPFPKASNFVKHMKTNKTLTYLDLSHNLIGSQVRRSSADVRLECSEAMRATKVQPKGEAGACRRRQSYDGINHRKDSNCFTRGRKPASRGSPIFLLIDARKPRRFLDICIYREDQLTHFPSLRSILKDCKDSTSPTEPTQMLTPHNKT